MTSLFYKLISTLPSFSFESFPADYKSPHASTQEARVSHIRDTIGICDPTHEVVSTVIRCGQDVLSDLGLDVTQYVIVVADTDVINALVYSRENERVIQVNRGLITFLRSHGMDTEEALKFVLGHEVGHCLMIKKDLASEVHRHGSITEEYFADNQGLLALDKGQVPQSPFAGLDLLRAIETEFSTQMLTLTHPKTHRRCVHVLQRIRTQYWRGLSTAKTPLSKSEIPRTEKHLFDKALYENMDPEHVFNVLVSKSTTYQDFRAGCRLLMETLKVHNQVEAMDLSSFDTLHTYLHRSDFSSSLGNIISGKLKAVNSRVVYFLTHNKSQKLKDIYAHPTFKEGVRRFCEETKCPELSGEQLNFLNAYCLSLHFDVVFPPDTFTQKGEKPKDVGPFFEGGRLERFTEALDRVLPVSGLSPADKQRAYSLFVYPDLDSSINQATRHFDPAVYLNLITGECVEEATLRKVPWTKNLDLLKLLMRVEAIPEYAYFKSLELAWCKSYLGGRQGVTYLALTSIDCSKINTNSLLICLQELLIQVSFLRDARDSKGYKTVAQNIASKIGKALIERLRTLDELTDILSHLVPFVTKGNLGVITVVIESKKGTLFSLADSFEALDGFIQVLLESPAFKEIAVRQQIDFYRYAMTHFQFEPQEALAHFNQLAKTHDLDTKGKLHYLEKKLFYKQCLLNNIYVEILNQIKGLEELKAAMAQTPYFNLTPQPEEGMYRPLCDRLDAIKRREVTDVYEDFTVWTRLGFCVPSKTLRAVPNEHRENAVKEVVNHKFLFLQHMDERDYDYYLSHLTWQWCYDKQRPLYQQEDFIGLLNLNPSVSNWYRYKDVRDDINIGDLDLSGLERMGRFFTTIGRPNEFVIGDVHATFETFCKQQPVELDKARKSDYPSAWYRQRDLAFEDLVYVLRRRVDLFDASHQVPFMQQAKSVRLEIVLQVFPSPSQDRNEMLMTYLGLSPTTSDPLLFVESIDYAGAGVTCLSLLEDSPLKECISNRVLREKRKRGHIRVSEFNYNTLTEYIQRHFPEGSRLGKELFDEWLQEITVSLDELAHLSEKRSRALESVRSSGEKVGGHYIIEWLADKIEDLDPVNKRELFEYVVGMQPDKPLSIQFLESAFSIDLSEFGAFLGQMTEGERLAFLSTLFLADTGLCKDEAQLTLVLQNIFQFTLHEEASEANALYVIFKELFMACDAYKQLDIITGIFSQLIKRPTDVTEESKSKIVKTVLVSFGVVGVKLGQILAQKPDVIKSEDMRQVLESLSDTAPAIGKENVLSALVFDRDASHRDAIKSVGPLLGSASIKQAYSVTDTHGEALVLKFVRPISHIEVGDCHKRTGNLGVLRAVLEKGAIQKLGRFSDTLLKEVNQAVQDELKIETERENQLKITEFMNKKGYGKQKGFGGWTAHVPDVHPVLQGAQFYCEVFMEGSPLKGAAVEALRASGDLKHVSLLIYKVLLDQILTLGQYNADLNPGNILVDAEAKRVGLIDYGNCATLSPENRKSFITLIKALGQSKSVNAIAALAQIIEPGNESGFKKITSQIELLFKSKSFEISEVLKGLNQLFQETKIPLKGEFEILLKVLDTSAYFLEYSDITAQEKRQLFIDVVGRWKILTH